MTSIAPLAPDQIYPTAQVAELLGVSEGTIRSRKSREKSQLQEGIHWLQQDGSTLWTCAGVLELAKTTQSDQAKALVDAAGAIVPAPIATPSVAATSTPDDAAPTSEATAGVALDLEWLEPLLDATGQGMALEFYRRLPEYVLKHIQRLATHPTEAERQVIQAAFQPIQRLQQEVPEQCES
jgi:hypothetical protein